jgi:hypothetical protein
MLFHKPSPKRQFILLGDGMAAEDISEEPRLTKREAMKAAKYFIASVGEPIVVRILDQGAGRILNVEQMENRPNVYLITWLGASDC